MPHSPPPVFELAVVLDDRPSVQRRLRISSGANLERLHRVVCIALGWAISAIFSIEYADTRLSSRLGETPALRLRQVLIDLGASLRWEYGDGQLWSATVTLVARHHPSAQLATPSCVLAQGSAPPADSDPWEEVEHDLPAPSCEAIDAMLLTLRH